MGRLPQCLPASEAAPFSASSIAAHALLRGPARLWYARLTALSTHTPSRHCMPPSSALSRARQSRSRRPRRRGRSSRARSSSRSASRSTSSPSATSSTSRTCARARASSPRAAPGGRLRRGDFGARLGFSESRPCASPVPYRLPHSRLPSPHLLLSLPKTASRSSARPGRTRASSSGRTA
jgi:hypothetical protein